MSYLRFVTKHRPAVIPDEPDPEPGPCVNEVILGPVPIYSFTVQKAWATGGPNGNMIPVHYVDATGVESAELFWYEPAPDGQPGSVPVGELELEHRNATLWKQVYNTWTSPRSWPWVIESNQVASCHLNTFSSTFLGGNSTMILRPVTQWDCQNLWPRHTRRVEEGVQIDAFLRAVDPVAAGTNAAIWEIRAVFYDNSNTALGSELLHLDYGPGVIGGTAVAPADAYWVDVTVKVDTPQFLHPYSTTVSVTDWDITLS